jgi:hypothetical protein
LLCSDLVAKLGERHSYAIVAANNLAAVLAGSDETGSAAHVIDDAYRLAHEVMGEDHPDTLVIRHNRERILAGTGTDGVRELAELDIEPPPM